MKPFSIKERAFGLLRMGLLRAASLMVPRHLRSDWWREWQGELWQVRNAYSAGNGGEGRSEQEATAFCLGAFPDALCLGRPGWKPNLAAGTFEGTPKQCLLSLVVLLTASYALALWLPGVRAERNLWQRKVNPNLVMIEQEGARNDASPTIAPAQVRRWEERVQQYFDGFAFYQVKLEHVTAGRRNTPPWRVARASSNLFTLLGLPVWGQEPGMAVGGVPEVILSERMWKKDFGADAHIAGEVVHLGERTARIAGVVADGSVELPGRVDAWLLEPDADEGIAGTGFVVAHLTEAGEASMWTQCVHIVANEPDGTEDDLLGVSLEEWRPSPEKLFLFAAFLALLSLPAITSVSLGEYSLNPRKTSWTRKLFRWSFLSAKFALLVPLIYFVSLDLGYGWTALGRDGAIYLQLISTFGLCLFGLCWILKDQRQRCPVCMRRVTHPAQVGQASRTFLDWNGTEMMCSGGHTLLHVPSLPTSWFSAQRWLYLDTSWDFLFASSTPPVP